MQHQISDDEYIVVLGYNGVYSVCRMNPSRRIAVAPNYGSASGSGIVSSPLTAEGLHDMLQWTDRETAITRFTNLRRQSGDPVFRPFTDVNAPGTN